MDRVCHFEIPFSDKKRAENFYTNVFGWQISAVPDMPYSFVITTPVGDGHQLKEPGGINGGMYERGEQGSTTPVVVIEVDSCAQRVKDVEASGGSALMGPQQIANMGIYAQVKDTEENIIGLWQPLSQGGE